MALDRRFSSHLLQGAEIGLDLRQAIHVHRQAQALLVGAAAHQPHGVLDHVVQVQHLEAHGHLAGLDLGHVEDVVDDRQQVLARRMDVRTYSA